MPPAGPLSGFRKGTERKPGGQHGGFHPPIAVPLDPKNVLAAVRFSRAGKTCEQLQPVSVWRENNSGYRPPAYHPAKPASSCVLLGATKPPPVSAPLPSCHCEPVRKLARQSASPVPQNVGRDAPGPPCTSLAGHRHARRAAPAHGGVNYLILGRNGRGGSGRADLLPQAGLDLHAPVGAAPTVQGPQPLVVSSQGSFREKNPGPRGSGPPRRDSAPLGFSPPKKTSGPTLTAGPLFSYSASRKVTVKLLPFPTSLSRAMVPP